MNKLGTFAQKVLDEMEPDVSRQQMWLDHHDFWPVSQAECITQFHDRIQTALDKKEKIMVAGDYDADGVLGTSIMVDGLRSLGLETGFYIPDRIREGYGLSSRIVRRAHERGYSLIITVDNGVKAAEALAAAKELGVDVIVTDHHTIEEEVSCQILVHPSLLEEERSSECGAAVAWECVRALGIDSTKHQMWAAAASITDCMQVIGQTRALIQKGIEEYNRQPEVHLSLLMKDRIINETSIAFQAGPMINAIGRLSNMANINNAVRYFLSDQYPVLQSFAMQTETINTQRKQMAAQMEAKALSKVRPAHPILLVEDESFHEGLIGLVAGKLCQTYLKPAIVAAKEISGGYKASMRAPDGFDCMEFLNLFDRYQTLGGHKKAAGFSVAPEDWGDFKKFVFRKGIELDWQPEEPKALEIEPEELTLENVEQLDLLRPFGERFRLPVLEIRNPKIKNYFDLSGGKHRRYALENGLECLCFNQSAEQMNRSILDIESFRGRVDISSYRGVRKVNFLIDEILYF